MTAPTRLVIPADMYEGIVAYCLDGMPNEACGFLGGRDGVAEKLYPLTNAAASPVFYKPDDREMLAALRDIDDSGLEVSCIFHSHVATKAYPSPTDIREAHYPDAVFLIVSFEDREHPYARGFLIHKADWRDPSGEVVEVEIALA
ncbi:MAG TPA: M67 family metallopeptidase [Acidimicrobiales bacterium]|nr:M67 family metallopeptidase [Acidimicrobiales bacterium]HLI57795.1 M67 family metallopeptidase [Actinomycetota bacterium]